MRSAFVAASLCPASLCPASLCPASLSLFCLVTLGGCTVLTGVSLEGNAGASYFDYAAGDTAQTGVGYQVGLTVSVELDYNRSSTMGLGLGPQVMVLPATEGSTTISGVADEYWLGSAIEGVGSETTRPRAQVGVQMLREQATFLTGYLGFGASFHGRRGRMWHVFAGPDYTVASGDHDEYRGWGGFVRVRYLRMFFSNCDRYIAPSASDGYVSVDDLCRGQP